MSFGTYQPNETEQQVFLDRLTASYIFSIGQFTQDLPIIADLPANKRVEALKKLHCDFAPKASAFLSDLAHSTASVVRTVTTLPSVKAQTLEQLKLQFLAEVYNDAIEELRTLASQTMDATVTAMEASAVAAHRASGTILGDVGAAATGGYLIGRIFGRGVTGGILGAAEGLEASFQRMSAAIEAASAANSASLQCLQSSDKCIMRFFQRLEANAEKLFDWASTHTFGSANNLELTASAACHANSIYRQGIVPVLPKLSIEAAINEMHAEQAREEEQRLQELKEQEEQRLQQHKELEEAVLIRAQEFVRKLAKVLPVVVLALLLVSVLIVIGISVARKAEQPPATNSKPSTAERPSSSGDGGGSNPDSPKNETPALTNEEIQQSIIPNQGVQTRRALPIGSPSDQVNQAPTATPETSSIFSNEQATAAFNWLQDRLQKPHAKIVSYDSEIDSYTWIGPKYGKRMSMPRSQFEAEIWKDYIKSHPTETSTGSKSGSGDLPGHPQVSNPQARHRVLKYHTDVQVQEPDGHWIHVQRDPYWSEE